MHLQRRFHWLPLAIAGLTTLGACSGEGEETGPTTATGAGTTATGTGGAGAFGGSTSLGGGGGTAGSSPTGGAGGAEPGEGCITGSFELYRGNFHAHTSYSDGEQEPQDAFAYARDVAGLDIMIVTDHLEQLYLVPPLNRFGECESQADAANATGTFLAHCGYEYGSGMELPLCISTGHNNVFFPTGLFPMVQMDFRDFYGSLVGCTECVGQFNHPGSESCQHWNNYEYHADADEKLTLFEFNGGGPVWDMFFQALDAGWHVSPMINQDNHSANWGTANDTRSGVFLESLARHALRTAMLERRTIMTEDKNASVVMMGDGICWMGSVMSGYSSLALTVHASDPDGSDGFEKIEFFGPGQTLLGSHDCAGATSCDATHDLAVTGVIYAVARATQNDGDVLVAAPIWVEP